MTAVQRVSKSIICALFFALCLLEIAPAYAQSESSGSSGADVPAGVLAARKRILIDIAHGQRFWNDPSDMEGKDTALINRAQYMTDNIVRNATALNAEIAFQKSAFTAADLTNADVIFLQVPTAKYAPDEVTAIQQYIKKGGSIFLVFEVDYWATLDQVNVNEIMAPFGIVFKGDSPLKSSGGHTKETVVTPAKLSIPYHGARLVEGGTPFCYSNEKTNEQPFGVYKEVPRGGRIVAMGEGMVSLYMTSWQDVHDYQCSEFMQSVFAWLLRKKQGKS